jgi:hypothetical protein
MEPGTQNSVQSLQYTVCGVRYGLLQCTSELPVLQFVIQFPKIKNSFLPFTCVLDVLPSCVSPGVFFLMTACVSHAFINDSVCVLCIQT